MWKIMILMMYAVIINTATGYHPESAKAMVLGLALRKKNTGKDVYYIHVRHIPQSHDGVGLTKDDHTYRHQVHPT